MSMLKTKQLLLQQNEIVKILDHNLLMLNDIKFTKHCDCLCSKCPNRINNVCNTENHIKMLDELTIKNYKDYIKALYTCAKLLVIGDKL